ncbi:MAG: CCA tRNA nucleotidyltransferase [Phycisphaerales bacterium]|nr:CCA tRNA nucleotidyltransferase [Phycisphaerales bacterium]
MPLDPFERRGPGSRAAALRVLEVLRGAGHVAYLAGGCVRDELLGLVPKDYDVATDATPDRIRSLFPRTAEVGASFGVVLVREPGPAGPGSGVTIEVATFRSDGPYSDKRRPDTVTFSDPESDARRRDFTINAIFLDPHAPPDSRIIDFVGGRADLAARVLRAVGDPDQRLAEDHLRALRAVRFAARFNLTIDPATGGAIRRHAAELAGVSRERIGDEMRRMMADPSRWRAVGLLGALGLDGPVLGEAAAPSGSPVESRLPRPGGGECGTFAECLAAWAVARGVELREHAGDRLVAAWRSALCLSNEEADGLRGILRARVHLERDWEGWPVARQKRLAATWPAGPAVDLLSPGRAAAVRARIAELAASPGGLAPAPLVGGDDLIGAGFAPGPPFKAILDRLYDEQLEGRVKSKAEALELAKRLGV